MAIAFARITYHSRQQGHSAVAGAAYRSGMALTDERTGEIHDYKNRNDVLYSQILLPEGASERFKDRAFLWNTVEAIEKRKNAQVAKDIILALPRDLALSHYIELAQNFAQYHFVQHGVVVDMAIHDHGEGNPHAHLYVTTRRLHGDRFDTHKARDLEPDVVRGRVVQPQYWGEQWREFQNDYFEKHEMDFVVDANYILSQRHEGRVREKKAHYLKEENQLRRAGSVEIALNDPESVLNLLGMKYAVFSERDIALLLHKNTETREEYETALLRLKAHQDLIVLGPGEDGRDRYTTRANYRREANMADQAQVLTLRHQHSVSETLVKKAVEVFSLHAEQANALSHVTSGGDIRAIVGRAGTGKSYLMRAAKQVWERSGYTVRGITVSGIAAKGLEADSGIPSTTLYSFKMQRALGNLNVGPQDIVVMDEAGMTDLHDMALVVDVVRETGAKVVLVGDPAQLQPIGPGAPFRALVEEIGFAELNHIQRQEDPEDVKASVLLSQGDIHSALQHYAHKQQIHLVPSDTQNAQESKKEKKLENDEEEEGGEGGSTALLRLVADWGKNLDAHNIQERLILAHRNIDVDALNKIARRVMQEKGLLGASSKTVPTTRGILSLSVGDRLLFLRNDRQRGVSNGEFATVLGIENDHMTVALGKYARELTFSVRDYTDFTYGYAATVHKSQGTTFDHTFVYVGGRAWDRFLAYVALTRHRKTLNLYADQRQFNDIKTLSDTLSRSAPKDSVLDWPLSFAIRRGFDPESLLGRFIQTIAGISQSIRDQWLFVTNYAAFKSTQTHRQSKRTRAEQRQHARKVALFVDVKNNLHTQAYRMRQELNPGERFYQHPNYFSWYEQCLQRNQLAYDIKKEYPLFEKALTLNRINANTLHTLSDDHERAQRVKTVIRQIQDLNPLLSSRLAKKIHADLSQHYSFLAYEAEKAKLSVKDIIYRINKEVLLSSKAIHNPQQSPELEKSGNTLSSKTERFHEHLAQEWKQLTTISSASIERLLTAKSRLDKAAKEKDRDIYQRSYDSAIKSLCAQEKIFSQVKVLAPHLSKTFEESLQPSKEKKIDWLSNEFKAEFNILAKSNDKQHQRLAQLRDWLRQDKDTPKEKFVLHQLESLAMKIAKQPSDKNSLQKLAPELTQKIIEFIQFKGKQRDLERDL